VGEREPVHMAVDRSANTGAGEECRKRTDQAQGKNRERSSECRAMHADLQPLVPCQMRKRKAYALTTLRAPAVHARTFDKKESRLHKLWTERAWLECQKL
jgi:hypothetical protein